MEFTVFKFNGSYRAFCIHLSNLAYTFHNNQQEGRHFVNRKVTEEMLEGKRQVRAFFLFEQRNKF